jgi:heme exporter protein CcmD
MYALQVVATVLAQAGDDIPNEIGYVWFAYGLTVGLIVAYAVYTIRRGRAVGRQLPPEDRRWM